MRTCATTTHRCPPHPALLGAADTCSHLERSSIQVRNTTSNLAFSSNNIVNHTKMLWKCGFFFIVLKWNFWNFGLFLKPDYNVSDHSEKYFSFLVYGEMPSSATVGQNYSFTVDVDLSGTAFSFQQDVTSSDAAVPQAVCKLYASRSWTMITNVVHLFIFCIITGFPLFFLYSPEVQLWICRHFLLRFTKVAKKQLTSQLH